MRETKEQSTVKGITLIALIITIIVMLILVSVTVNIAIGDGLFDKAGESTFKTKIKQYEDELTTSKILDETKVKGTRNKFNVIRNMYEDADSFVLAMKEIIPSFDEKYANKLEIREDKLIYIGENDNERKWLNEFISVAKILKINYVYENGNIAAQQYKEITTEKNYEVKSPEIEGYMPDHYMVIGQLDQDTEITVTYYGGTQELEYEELDTNNDGQTDAYTVAGHGTFKGETLVIPRTYNNKPVTQIKNEAFAKCNTVKKAIIPSSIEETGVYIFGFDCKSLEYLFTDVNNSGDKYKPAFCGLQNLKKLDIGPNVKSIGIQTFMRNENLTDVTVYSNNVERLCAGSFQGCNSLQKVKVSSDNTGYKEVDGIVYSKDGKTLVLYPPGKTNEDFKILDTVETIGEYACAYNTFLKRAEISSDIKKVNNFAFNKCNNLEYANINAEEIKGCAFENCGLKKVDIKENVKSIGDACFRDCTNLTDVTIYSEQTNITGYQFDGCSLLKRFKLKEEHGKYIEIDGALYSNGGKTLCAYPQGKEGEFVIPEGVESIERFSFFSGYSKLTKLELPSSVNKVDLAYFGPLEKIYYKGTKEQWSKVTLNIANSTIKTITCSDGTIEL